MNKLTEKLAGAITAGALLVTLTHMPVYPQTRPGQVSGRPSPQVRGQAAVTLPRERGRIPAGRVVVNRRQPIPFRKFEMRDPKTGQAIPPNSTITLRSGRKVTAAQYFGAINELEQKLCAIGYSLRNPQTKSIIQRLNVDQAKLQEQKRRLAARSSAPSVTAVGSDVRVPPKGERTQINTVNSWSARLGDPEILAVFLDAKVQLTGSPTITKVDAEANAGCDIFGSHNNVLRGTVALATPKTGAMNTRVNLSAFGVSFFDLDKNTTANFMKEERLSSGPWKKSIEYNFTLEGIPVSVELGASFTIGANYKIDLRPTNATAILAPSVRSSAFLQAAVDLEADFGIAVIGAEAGAEGKIILLNDDMTLQGQLSIDLDPSGKPFFFERYFGVNNLEALSGSLEVYVEVCAEVPFLWEECKKYSTTLWNFDGFKDNGILFKGSRKTFIN